jgi:hypothetical protein
VSLLTDLAELLDEQLALMSDKERQQFAAYLQTHPELNADWEAIASSRAGGSMTRASADERMELMAAHTLVWMTTAGALDVSRRALVVTVGAALYAPNPLTIGLAALSAGSTITCKILSDRYGNRAINTVGIHDAIGYGGVWFKPFETRAGGEYDHTLSNGGSLTFDVEVRYRSVSAEDIDNPAASGIVSAGDIYSTVWALLDECIEKLRSLINSLSPLEKSVPEIASITAPKTETEAFDGELTLQILSGNVSAEKTGGNSFKFTTSAEEDVEFTFKLFAGGTELGVYTGLLEVPEKGYDILGKWKYINMTSLNKDGTTNVTTSPNYLYEYYTFLPDGRVYYEWAAYEIWYGDYGTGMVSGESYYGNYNYDPATNTGSWGAGVGWYITMQSETTLTMSTSLTDPYAYIQHWTKVSE